MGRWDWLGTWSSSRKLHVSEDCLAEVARAESAVFGPVASDPTVSRLVDTLAAGGLVRWRRSGGHGPKSAGTAARDVGGDVLVERGRCGVQAGGCIALSVLYGCTLWGDRSGRLEPGA